MENHAFGHVWYLVERVYDRYKLLSQASLLFHERCQFALERFYNSCSNCAETWNFDWIKWPNFRCLVTYFCFVQPVNESLPQYASKIFFADPFYITRKKEWICVDPMSEELD